MKFEQRLHSHLKLCETLLKLSVEADSGQDSREFIGEYADELAKFARCCGNMRNFTIDEREKLV